MRTSPNPVNRHFPSAQRELRPPTFFQASTQMTKILRKKRNSLIWMLIALAALPCHAADKPVAAAAKAATAPVVVVPASDPRIQYIGRFDDSNPDAPRFAWSGSIIKARYKAERITLLLKDDPPANRTDDSGAPFRNWFDVLIDGQLAVTIVASPDRTRYEIPRQLGNGPRTISIFKRTEAVVGVSTFLGFELSGGGRLLDPPARPDRRIEFVGDSITAGLDVVKVGTGVFTLAAENNRITYAAVAARRLGAESVCMAYSGNGVHCNGGDKKNAMPVLYERIIPQEPESRWDFTRWTPQVVVIHLGVNDVGAARSGLCKDDFQLVIDSYVTFVARVRKQYPQAHIFCMIGPVLWHVDLLTKLPLDTVETFRKKGDTKVHYLRCDDIGGDLHPDVANQRKMGDMLVKAIAAETGWSFAEDVETGDQQ